MLADLLSDLGLYLGGNNVQEDSEASYFFRANRKILLHIHGHSDNPSPMRYFYRNKDAVEATTQSLEADARSWRIAKFLGWGRFLKYRSLERFDQPWGWKDPQNVFTLSLWLKVFPNSKVIYIVRNGVDVASSLRIMEQRDIRKRQKRSQRVSYVLRGKSSLEQHGFKGAVRHLYLDGGFSLWEEYMAQAEEVLASANISKLVIRYEDFLSSPVERLFELRDFCGLAGHSNLFIENLAKEVDKSRAHTFLKDPQLREFYSQVEGSPWMKRNGYAGLMAQD